MRITRENYRAFLKPFRVGIIGTNPKATMNERYRLSHHGPNHSKPYYIAKYVPFGISKEKGFWQQISPSYMYQYSAINFAKKHNIELENPPT